MSSPNRKPRLQTLSQKLQCPIDPHANYSNSFWCNRDLIPIPANRRTWTWQGYAGYWIIGGVNTTSWTAASSLLALGLSVKEAMGVIVGASLVVAVLAVAAGWMGSHQFVGFTILSRGQVLGYAWGFLAGAKPNRDGLCLGLQMGIQTYWGGQAVKIILGAVIGPKFAYMGNTLPVSAHVDTASLISFFVFLAIFAPMLLLPPEKLQMPFRVAFVMITSTVFGMLIWAIRAAHGAGDLVHTGPSLHGRTLSWNTVYGLQGVVGAWGSGCLGQSDWTRYAKTPNAAVFGQSVTAPIAICITALCGLLITSATAKVYGEVLWNPFVLLLTIQKTSMSPGARAGTFFAGLGFLASQLALCIVTNSVAAGMDIAALYPKYINIRRGSYIITIVSICICPWQFVTQATTFITVLSGWAVFLSPMTGIVISDYFLVRKRELHVGDLYRGDSSSAYWYFAGFNWRAFLAWAMGLWPLLPGFVREVRGVSDGSAWDHLYNVSYFFGFFVALLFYWVFSAISPTKRQTGASPFVLDPHGAGVPQDSSSEYDEVMGSGSGEKRAVV